MISHASQNYRVTAPTAVAHRVVDSVEYLAVVLCVLALFYWEHRAASRFLKTELDLTLGYFQAVLCWVLMLTGLGFEWLRPNVDPSSATSTAVLILALGGELVFLMNVVVVYRRQESAPIDASRLAQSPGEYTATTATPEQKRVQAPLSTWTRPTAPVHQFGVTAIFLAAGGLATLLSSSKLIVPWGGQVHIVPMGVLWWAAALPFALFALGYWRHSGQRVLAYDRGTTSAHLAISFLWLLDFVRVTIIWQATLPATYSPVDLKAHALEIFSILAGATLLFSINLLRGPELRAQTRVSSRTAG